MRSTRHDPTAFAHAWRSASLAFVLLAFATSASAAGSDAAPAQGKERAVVVEAMEGSTLKRVVLSAKAVQRLDIRTAAVGEQAIVPVRTVGGVVVDPSAGGAAPRPAARTGELWVRVALSPPEWSALAKDMPARVSLLQPRAGAPKEITASPNGADPLESAKSGMLSVFYVLPPATTGVAVGDRARVELAFAGGGESRKVVPYSAVYYDAKGQAWVYVSTGARAFVRQPVKVEHVTGDVAVLASGPEAGAQVATVGVPMLYGAEIFGK